MSLWLAPIHVSAILHGSLLVMAGEISFRAAHERRDAALAAEPANGVFLVFVAERRSREEMLTISGADRFGRRGGVPADYTRYL